MKTVAIKVQLAFEHEHCWPEAPAAVGFLAHLHRHMFHVTLIADVEHDDRELEFILVKRRLQNWISDVKAAWPKRISCEQMASCIGEQFMAWYGRRNLQVEVSEDGENGAIVMWTKEE